MIVRRRPSTSRQVALMTRLLEPMAHRAGLSYDAQVLEPGSAPEQSAFQAVYCGAWLMLGYCDDDGFPASTQRTRRKGAKAMERGYVTAGGERGAIFLAHAMATVSRERDNVGVGQDAEVYERLRCILSRHYPLSVRELELLDACLREYRVLQTHEVSDAVKLGYEMGTGYTLALSAPELYDCKHPDDVPELVQMQAWEAIRYFCACAARAAARLVLGELRFSKLEPELFQPGSFSNTDQYIYRIEEVDRWIAVIEHEDRRFARAALPVTVAPALDDEVAQRLRVRVDELLEEAPPISDIIKPAVSANADKLAGTDTDWNIATDALFMGYRLRQAECECEGWLQLDDDNADRLRRIAVSEPDVAVGVGVLTVIDTLPEPFAAGLDAWHQLRAWAVGDAYERSVTRRRLGREPDIEPTFDADACGRAFDAGYAIRFAEQTIKETPPVGAK